MSFEHFGGLGVGLYIENFGDKAPLNTLCEFPLNALKFDENLLENSTKSTKMFQALINFADTLNLKITLAPEAKEIAKSKACNSPGYFLSESSKTVQISKFLEENNCSESHSKVAI